MVGSIGGRFWVLVVFKLNIMKTTFLIAIILFSSCSAGTLSIKDQQKKEIQKVKKKKTKQEVKKELRILGFAAIIGFFIGYEIGNNYK